MSIKSDEYFDLIEDKECSVLDILSHNLLAQRVEDGTQSPLVELFVSFALMVKVHVEFFNEHIVNAGLVFSITHDSTARMSYTFASVFECCCRTCFISLSSFLDRA